MAGRGAEILRVLRKAYPDAKCSLDYRTPLQLLVATILSAQCTDKRVNLVTKGLFKKYKTAADFAKASEGELEKEIQSTGFFRSKAKSIRSMAASLLEKHGGRVPETMEELTARWRAWGGRRRMLCLGMRLGRTLASWLIRMFRG